MRRTGVAAKHNRREFHSAEHKIPQNFPPMKLIYFLVKGLRPMWRSFAVARARDYLCVAGDGTLQELGNIDMVDSTPPSQQC